VTWVSLVQVVSCEAFVAFYNIENAFVAESFRFIMLSCNCLRTAAQQDMQHDTLSRDKQPRLRRRVLKRLDYMEAMGGLTTKGVPSRLKARTQNRKPQTVNPKPQLRDL